MAGKERGGGRGGRRGAGRGVGAARGEGLVRSRARGAERSSRSLFIAASPCPDALRTPPTPARPLTSTPMNWSPRSTPSGRRPKRRCTQSSTARLCPAADCHGLRRLSPLHSPRAPSTPALARIKPLGSDPLPQTTSAPTRRRPLWTPTWIQIASHPSPSPSPKVHDLARIRPSEPPLRTRPGPAQVPAQPQLCLAPHPSAALGSEHCPPTATRPVVTER